VAYDKKTGKRVWRAGDSKAAYASPQLAQFGGLEQILSFHADGLTSYAASDGRILWNIPWVTPPERNNVCQPVVWIDETGRETIFVASGYGKGCGLFDVAHRDQEFVVSPRWQSMKLQAKFASVVEKNGYVYGLDNNILCCIDLRTGQRPWKGGRYGYGQLMLVDDYLLVLGEEGQIVLCEANPVEHREVASFPVLNSRTWNHPALSGDKLLIRNDRMAACVKLATKTPRNVVRMP
jgi:outer membrane protein assembly factor BamB